MSVLDREYESLLAGGFDYNRFYELCTAAFKYGEFDKIDEIVVLSMPILNIAYHQSVHKYDDDYSAKEDLIQDALLVLIHDMKHRWDKYIHVDNYYEYVKITVRNAMLMHVSNYHSYNSQVEYDPELHGKECTAIDNIEINMINETIEETVNSLALELLSHRLRRPAMMIELFTHIYIYKEDEVKQNGSFHRYLIHGIGTRLLNFYRSRVQYIYSISVSYHKAQVKGDAKVMKAYEELMSRIRSDEYEILSTMYGDTPLPEIYAELGHDATLKLIQLVGGTQVQFPDTRELSDTLLGGIVYQLVDGRVENLEGVSEVYKLPYATLKRVFNRHLSNLQRRESAKK